MSYAQNTSVSVERSRAELERTLVRYGADSFQYGWEGGRAAVMFRAQTRYVRFLMEMPKPDDEQFILTDTRRIRSESQVEKLWEQACRQRWRALNLVVKAKLEAVEAGIATFEEEFLAHILLPDGTTVAENVVPRVEEAYETGQMVASLLPSTRQLTAGKSA